MLHERRMEEKDEIGLLLYYSISYQNAYNCVISNVCLFITCLNYVPFHQAYPIMNNDLFRNDSNLPEYILLSHFSRTRKCVDYHNNPPKYFYKFISCCEAFYTAFHNCILMCFRNSNYRLRESLITTILRHFSF